MKLRLKREREPEGREDVCVNFQNNFNISLMIHTHKQVSAVVYDVDVY